MSSVCIKVATAYFMLASVVNYLQAREASYQVQRDGNDWAYRIVGSMVYHFY